MVVGIKADAIVKNLASVTEILFPVFIFLLLNVLERDRRRCWDALCFISSYNKWLWHIYKASQHQVL